MLQFLRLTESRFYIASLVIMLVPLKSFAEEENSPGTLDILKTFRSEFIEITPGEGKFPKAVSIGSTSGPESERPVHEVEFTKKILVSKYEVYQNLYETVMGSNPSRWKGPRNSAERMTFAEAEQFCTKVTNLLVQHKLIEPKQVVRLPTEREWEYFTRAGSTSAYSFGEKAQLPEDAGNKATLLDPYAWHTGNAAGNDPEVGVLKPNPWGLYDVHGYLWEYCSDDWKPNYSENTKSDENFATIRGGSWKDPASRLTSSTRLPFPKSGRDDAVGFRCVLSQE